jgi:hypothetical protein
MTGLSIELGNPQLGLIKVTDECGGACRPTFLGLDKISSIPVDKGRFIIRVASRACN